MKVGSLVKRKNPWIKMNPWMVFPDADEPAIILEMEEGHVRVRWLWKQQTEWIFKDLLIKYE